MADDDVERIVDHYAWPALRILVTGSRSWTDKRAVADGLTAVIGECGAHLIHGDPPALDWHRVTVVHGDAAGADRIADRIARAWGMTVEAHPADWSRHGRSAGHQRNAEMVRLGADVCLAFPLGESRGTRGCMQLAEKAGIPVRNLGDPAEQPDLFGEVRHAG